MNTATITPRENALGRICGYDVTTPTGELVPFQSYAHAKHFVAQGCPG